MRAFVWTISATLGLTGCGRSPNSASPPTNEASGTAVPLRYAKSFTIEKRGSVRIVTVLNAWKDARNGSRYVLVPKGVEPPSDVAGEIVRTPVGKYAALSTTHLASLDELGRLNDLVGFAGPERVHNPKVLEGFKRGGIKPIGAGDSASQERIAALNCEVLFASDFSEDAPARADVLRRLGVQVVMAADFSEEHPLGRAEWIRFFATFFDEDEKAERLFRAQVDEYRRLANMAATTVKRPTVLLNAPYRGVWHVPTGRSMMAKVLKDAGADYLWAGTGSGEEPLQYALQFEAVLAKAADADYWLNPGQWTSLAEAKGEDERYALFAAFRRGAVYNCDLKKSPEGGTDYWETGVNHPERVLADLVAIFHPDLVPGHRMNWYRKLP
jgi:iron complex transport system substrate-binding protein